MSDQISSSSGREVQEEKAGIYVRERHTYEGDDEKVARNHSVADTLTEGQIDELEVAKGFVAAKDLTEGQIDALAFDGEGIIADDDDTVIDPRLRDYEPQLVARTVDLKNDPTEPILTFRFWFLSTFWVGLGCAFSSFYYFKPYGGGLTSYAIQLLSWGMGDAMGRWLPKRQFNTFGYKWSLNPGPWNAKEHALIVVAYWGSCYTAFGMGPLSALELFYGAKLNWGWSLVFLICTQMIGYGFAGLYRDILVRPPEMYYPGELPNVALFNAMHKNPSLTKKALGYFCTIAAVTFVYEWIPEVIAPFLQSMPLLCYMGHGHWVPFLLGSGFYGAGLLCFSADWNYIGALQPLYTPLWATLNTNIFTAIWLFVIVPALYFSNALNAQGFAFLGQGTYTANGSDYDPTQVLTANFELNETALAIYGRPYFSTAYVAQYFFTFAAITASMTYAILFYGKTAYKAFFNIMRNKKDGYENDPYIQIMSKHKRVPHWWYLLLLLICAGLAIAQLYEGPFRLTWWGFIVISLISFIFTWPNGILWGVANTQMGMTTLGDILSGVMFRGKPTAVLAASTYGTTILEQNLNLISDYKFGFYMKIPEREMFIGQVWGTLLGPFINLAIMQVVVKQEFDELTGAVVSSEWNGQYPRGYFSVSMLWGVLGPENFFSGEYSWVLYGLLVGPIAVFITWLIHLKYPKIKIETMVNPTLIFMGALTFPGTYTTIFSSGFLMAVIFMGIIYRYNPQWWRKYNYLTGVGLDCGTQFMSVIWALVTISSDITFPTWALNNPNAQDLCFIPDSLPPAALNIY